MLQEYQYIRLFIYKHISNLFKIMFIKNIRKKHIIY